MYVFIMFYGVFVACVFVLYSCYVCLLNYDGRVIVIERQLR